MEVTVDVAVVGAGPAGSTLAAMLAGAGTSVALIDRDEFPRDKLCGEFLSWDALPIVARLGVDLDRAGASRIERCRVVGRTRVCEFAFPEPARGISRFRFDDLLFRAALARGAQPFAPSTAVSLSDRDVVVTRGGGEVRIRARVVAGAWGRWGRFDARLGRSFARGRSPRSFGFKRHYRSPDEDRAAIELYSFDGGYLGVNRIEEGRTTICGLVDGRRLHHHRGRWPAFIETLRSAPHLDRLFARHEPAQEEFLSSEPVVFRPREAVERGIIMVGDASGIIDPLAGNGMAMAMQSAVLAAPYIARILDAPDRRATIEREYSAAHRNWFGRRIAWSRRAALLLSHPFAIEAALTLARPSAGAFLLRNTRASREAVERLCDASSATLRA